MRRGDVDDRAFLCGFHFRQDPARDEPGGFQIDREHVLPLILRHRDGIGVDVAPGVVDQAGHGAEGASRRLQRLGDVACAPHVAFAEDGALVRAERRDEVSSRPLLDVDDRNARALDQRLLDDRRADAASPAGHQHMLAFDASRHGRATSPRRRRRGGATGPAAPRRMDVWRRRPSRCRRRSPAPGSVRHSRRRSARRRKPPRRRA